MTRPNFGSTMIPFLLKKDLFTHFPSYKNKRKMSFQEEKEKEEIERQRNIDKNTVYY